MARQSRLDRQHVCDHKRKTAEQPAARQPWNDSEEQNKILPLGKKMFMIHAEINVELGLNMCMKQWLHGTKLEF